jgi:hypothetical protein
VAVLEQTGGKTTRFVVARVTEDGLSEVYEVDKGTIKLLFKFPAEGNFTNVLLLAETAIFMWNQ